jgi:hypothetical protein
VVGAGVGGFNSVRTLKFIWKIAPSLKLLLSPHKSKKKNSKAHAPRRVSLLARIKKSVWPSNGPSCKHTWCWPSVGLCLVLDFDDDVFYLFLQKTITEKPSARLCLVLDFH